MVLNEEGLKEVGRIVTYFSYLEYAYKKYYGELNGLDTERSYQIVGEMRFKELLNLFRKTIHEKFKDEELKLKHFDDIINETFKYNNIRNEIVHGYWIGFSNESREAYLNLRTKKDLNVLKDESEKYFGGKMTFYKNEDLSSISGGILLNMFRLGILINHDSVFKYTTKYIK